MKKILYTLGAILGIGTALLLVYEQVFGKKATGAAAAGATTSPSAGGANVSVSTTPCQAMQSLGSAKSVASDLTGLSSVISPVLANLFSSNTGATNTPTNAYLSPASVDTYNTQSLDLSSPVAVADLNPSGADNSSMYHDSTPDTTPIDYGWGQA